MINEKIVPRSFGTHDGSFHADEVTACALLIIFNKIDLKKIVRTRDENRLCTCEYVCDVGGVYDPKKKKFDHHQSDYKGIYSSAGMVLKHLKSSKVISRRLYHYLNRSLIKGVDAIDNGKASPPMGHSSFSSVISNFVPAKHDIKPQILHQAFLQALKFCIGHIRRLIDKFHHIQECYVEIQAEMEKNKEVLFFERPMPWLDIFFELGGEYHPALFVIMPIGMGKQWKLRAVPPTHKKQMQVRMPLPKEWAGLIDTELKKKSKIPGALFCHKGRFISVWDTKESAIAACEYVLKNRKR